MTSRARRMRLAVIIFAVFRAFSSTALFAQSTTEGAIGGVVADQTRGDIPGATGTAKSVATTATATAVTDANGRFTVIRLQPGVYSMSVELSGFAPLTRNNIVVEVGRVTNTELTLGLAGQFESLDVVAQTPVINREGADVSTNINAVSIENLPVSARRWSNFVLGTPGAAPDGTFGLISFRGISGLLNNNTVDGGDNTQAFFAEERGRTRLSYSLSLGAVQEFQVTTSNYSAEYGRAAGGVVNAVTKSGSNQLKGEGFYYIRDNKWGASNPFTTRQQLVNGVFTSVRIKPDDRRQQYGLSAGGPLVPNTLFFFASVDQQKRYFPGTAVPGNPTAFFAPLTSAELATLASRGVNATQAADGLAFVQSLTGTVERSGDQTLLFPKIDWQISSNHSLAVSYNHLRWKSPAGVQTAATVANGVDNWGNDGVDNDWLIGKVSSLLGSRFTNELRFQWGRDFEYQTSQPAIPGEPVVPGTTRSPNVSISGTAAFGFGKPNFLDRRAYPDERRIQVSDTATLVSGTHLFKFGVDINRTHDLLDSLFQEGGVYSYTSRADFISDYELNAKLNSVGRFYSTFSQGIGPTAFQFASVDYAAFIQDTWHVRPRLTLNWGLRYDYEQMPDPQIANPLEPRTGVLPSDKNNWGPRVGVNWDVTGAGRTVLRGGYGMFYGRIINSTISNAITNTGMATGQISVTVSPTQAGAPAYPNILANASASPSRPNIVFFGTGAQNPLIHQFDLIFDQRIAANTVLSVSWVGSQGRHLPIFIDQNLNAPTTTNTYRAIGGPLDGQSLTTPLFTLPRPNANFTQMTQVTSGVNTSYNALVLALNRRFTGGLQVQSSYTYSRATDNGQSSQTFSSANNVLNPFDLSLEEARSNFDIPHRFSFSAVWQPKSSLPVFSNFTIAPVIGASAGSPFTPGISGNAPQAATVRVLTGILGAGGLNRLPSMERNSNRLPYATNVDLRISRAFPLPGRAKIEVLGEAFNLFNRVNYTSVNSTFYTIGGTVAAPTLTYNSATFNAPTNANSGTFSPRPREVQLGLRFTF
ncbi:MAG: carboxypeptidase regulatory-like domain-containing protein [Vicinamibacterales bacterium]|nr:carboxypeptidase regulatory-like domain-containing protein [Vicinamibacterales bacterium]